MINRFQSSVTRLALGLLAIACVAFTSEAKPKRVLLVTVTMGFHHTSTKSAEKIIPELGAKSGKFTVDIVRSGPEPKGAEAVAAWKEKARKDLAEHMSPEALKQYDLILFANTTMDLPIPSMDAFLDFIKSGKGFVGIHSASDTFHSKGDQVSAYVDMLGSEFLTHQAQATVECLNMDPSFPATKHFDSSITFHDEIYLMKNFHREKVHGLLTLDKHPNTRQPGDYPIAWCKNYGKGRVFYTSLGHREDVWDSPLYQEHVLHGILWALGLEKGDATPQSTKLVLAKSEVKEGFKPLFNGTDTTGWHLRNPDGTKSWSTQNGMLVNTLKQGEHGVDLVTDEKYWNFTVRFEYMIPKGSNSGFYLRGRHEIQIFDDFAAGKPSLGGNGAIYQHTAPSKFASGQAGEWQTVEATMVGNKVSVILNGIKIHDNVVVERATGSELDKNVDQPGQLFLQGDHGAIAFRNLRIKVLK